MTSHVALSRNGRTLQTLCVTTVEICCTSQRRSHQCHLGLRAGQTGRQCLRLSGVGGDAFQDCCLGCKMGLQVNSAVLAPADPVQSVVTLNHVSSKASSKVGDDDGTCRDLAGVFQHPWDTSFISCCEEIRNGTFTEPDDAHAGVLCMMTWVFSALNFSFDCKKSASRFCGPRGSHQSHYESHEPVSDRLPLQLKVERVRRRGRVRRREPRLRHRVRGVLQHHWWIHLRRDRGKCEEQRVSQGFQVKLCPSTVSR